MAIADKVCKETDEMIGANALHHPKLAQADAIRKLSEAMSENLRKIWSHGSLRGEVLEMFFKHQVGALEFTKDKEHILRRMRLIYVKEKMREMIVFRDVVAKVKHGHLPKTEPPRKHAEIAAGEFEIVCDDPQLRAAFERLRETIRKDRDGREEG